MINQIVFEKKKVIANKQTRFVKLTLYPLLVATRPPTAACTGPAAGPEVKKGSQLAKARTADKQI